MLVRATPSGLYCEAGDFYIDPWRSVDRALVTHGHSDHARPGSRMYLTSRSGAAIVQHRLPAARVEGVEFGQRVTRNGVTVSFHPAGHLLGSSQIRIEYKGEVWVVSGDYKTEVDATCEAFEPVRCHTFITESTFALPIYRWSPQHLIFAEIERWRAENAERGVSSVLLAYSLGKAQRLLAGVSESASPVIVHPSVQSFLPLYEAEGVRFPEYSSDEALKRPALLIAPQQAVGTDWTNSYAPYETAFVSGWMLIRGSRRRGMQRGFAMSDHADWEQLLWAIGETGAERVLVTHGYTKPLVRYLKESGLDAATIPTHFEREELAELSAEPES